MLGLLFIWSHQRNGPLGPYAANARNQNQPIRARALSGAAAAMPHFVGPNCLECDEGEYG